MNVIWMVLIVLAMMWVRDADAQNYVTFGAGYSDFKNAGDGVWYQQPFNHREQKSDTAYLLGIGHRFGSWPIEADALDFGQHVIEADTMNGPDAHYDSHRHVVLVQDPMIHIYGFAHVKALAVTANYSHAIGPVSLTAGLGVARWYQRWSETVYYPSGSQQIALTSPDAVFSGTTGCYRYGISYAGWSVSRFVIPTMAQHMGATNAAQMTTINYTRAF